MIVDRVVQKSLSGEDEKEKIEKHIRNQFKEYRILDQLIKKEYIDLFMISM